jgi:hypothetical protein
MSSHDIRDYEVPSTGTKLCSYASGSCPVSGCHIHSVNRNAQGHPVPQARAEATNNERADVLASVAALIERNDEQQERISMLEGSKRLQADEIARLRQANAGLVAALEEIKALCVKERAR